MGIKVLFIYPNTFGMNMLPPAIATFSAILKKNGHKVQVFDTTYYSTDYGNNSDGTKEEGLNVIPFSEALKKRGLAPKETKWEDDLKKQINIQAFVTEENFTCHLLMLHNAFVNH